MSDPIARATALYQEGRYAEAEEELAAAPDDLTARAIVSLCRSARGVGDPSTESSPGGDPADAVVHADRGWERLRGGEPRAALESFRAALELDPGLEFARAGAAEAVETRYWGRRRALGAIRGLGRLRPYWWVLLLGFFVLTRLTDAVAVRYPWFAPAVVPITVAYIAFFVATWTASALSDAMLLCSRFGFLALSPARRLAAGWSAGCAAGFSACVAFRLFGPSDYTFLWRAPATGFVLLLLPVSFVTTCRPGWPRRVMICYAAVLTVLVLVGTGLFAATVSLIEQNPPAAKSCYRYGRDLFDVVPLACLAAAIGSIWLTSVRPRK